MFCFKKIQLKNIQLFSFMFLGLAYVLMSPLAFTKQFLAHLGSIVLKNEIFTDTSSQNYRIPSIIDLSASSSQRQLTGHSSITYFLNTHIEKFLIPMPLSAASAHIDITYQFGGSANQTYMSVFKRWRKKCRIYQRRHTYVRN